MEFLKPAYIYAIEYEGKPIYIGSTRDVLKRQKGHNKGIAKSDAFLYRQLRLLNIKEVNLKVLKQFDNYCYKGKKKKFYEYRYFVEDKYIRRAIDKGLVLLNTYFACEHDAKMNYVPQHQRLIAYPLKNTAPFKPEISKDLFSSFGTIFDYE